MVFDGFQPQVTLNSVHYVLTLTVRGLFKYMESMPAILAIFIKGVYFIEDPNPKLVKKSLVKTPRPSNWPTTIHKPYKTIQNHTKTHTTTSNPRPWPQNACFSKYRYYYYYHHYHHYYYYYYISPRLNF